MSRVRTTCLISCPALEFLSTRYVVFSGKVIDSCLAIASPTTPTGIAIIARFKLAPFCTHHHRRPNDRQPFPEPKKATSAHSNFTQFQRTVLSTLYLYCPRELRAAFRPRRAFIIRVSVAEGDQGVEIDAAVNFLLLPSRTFHKNNWYYG